MRNHPTSRVLPAIILAAAVSLCVTESAEPPALRETLPNGALLVRYPDLPAIDAIGPEVTEAHVDLKFGSLEGDDPNLIFGDTLVVIEAGVPALPVTDEDRAAYIERAVEDGPEARRAAEEVAALMPDLKPVRARMFVDDEGRLWVQRLTPEDAPAFYDLYNENGDYLGSVRFAFTPAFSLYFWVQHGSIYTWVVDEMDVQYVVRAPVG